MGYLFKRKRSKFWYARWQANGQEHIVSTKCRDRSEAAAQLLRLEAGGSEVDLLLHDLHQALDKLTDDTRDKKINFIIDSLRVRKATKLAINQGWNVWWASPKKKRTPKSKTLNGYSAIWNRFQNWCSQHNILFFHDLTRTGAEDYAKNLWQSSISPRTYNAHIKQLQAMFGVVEVEAGLTTNIWKSIPRKDEMPEGRRNLSLEELRMVFSKAEGNWKIMLAVGMFTGLRLGDVANLRWADTLVKPGFLVVMPMKTSRKKKVVEIPIHEALAKILVPLRTQNPSAEFIFPQQQKLYLKGACELTKHFKTIFESCGIKTTQEAASERRRAIVRVGFHSLRHSFVSLSGKSGTSLPVIQGIVGHGSPAMTEIYMHLDEGQKLLATAHFPNILNGLADMPLSDGRAQNSDKIGVDEKDNRNGLVNPPKAG